MVVRFVIRSFAYRLHSSPKMAVATDSPARPSANIRHPTAPSVLTMNGHFAAVGEKPTEEQFEHGAQIISEDQQFKSRPRILSLLLQLTYTQSLSAQIPFPREDLICGFQLSSHICLWFAIYREINTTQSSLRNRVWCHVRARQETDNQRYLDV